MRVFDAHCDLLYKLYFNSHLNFLVDSDNLQVTLNKLRQGMVKIQVFAIYIPPTVHPNMRFRTALAQIDIFKHYVLEQGGLKLICTGSDIANIRPGEIGAILSLEGCDCIDEDIVKLRTLFHLGVRAVGLTWNFANLVADGVEEPRCAGLSLFGQSVVQELNKSKICCDVSHLSEAGFWDVMELASYPIASHSNSRKITNHVRNLTDEQFLAIIKKGGTVGLTFVPEFLTASRKASIKDVLNHLDHFCSLGGKNNIGFGSDFDGTTYVPSDLHDARSFNNLQNELAKYYSNSEVEAFLYTNFANNFANVLA